MPNHLFECELTPEQMLENLPDFMEKISRLASDIGIDLTGQIADHIALRINDEKLAHDAHQAWLNYGKVISSAIINGRPIVVLEFENQLSIQNWQIECLEIPYPAEGKSYPEQGWEHMEFVIPSQAKTADDYLADLKLAFPQFITSWEKMAEMGITTKLSSPKGENERLPNPTVAFKGHGVCIKLHPHSLKKVVMSEMEK